MKRHTLSWLSVAALALEANHVIALRLMKLARGGRNARAEASRMASEKVGEAMAASVTLATGGTVAKVIRHYRKRVRANARRLSRRKRR
ncbi:MAG TPA: hypothetical protein VFS63_16140 [Pseudolabrys sp.]|jgi:hypothetical protein|nr:hypothetical protein [Pseudolabrys sp.]